IWFQSAPAFEGGRNGGIFVDRYIGHVSIRSRLRRREKFLPQVHPTERSPFQSAPAFEGGRNPAIRQAATAAWFQSAPAFEGGRNALVADILHILRRVSIRSRLRRREKCMKEPQLYTTEQSFNPLPPSKAGEIEGARPVMLLKLFQSAPAFEGGRND